MMGAPPFTVSRHAFFLLTLLIGFPGSTHSATLEDSAKDLARKIVAALPERDNISCEIRNRSSLRPEEVARVEQSVKTELAMEGEHLAEGGGATRVTITLSESRKEYVWTAEIGGGDASRALVLAVARDGGDHAASNAMHIVVRSERFWEGPERILDAAEMSNGGGQSWLVLMTPSGLAIEDLQTGASRKIGIAPETSNSRDPWGQLGPAPLANEVWFRTFSHMCRVNLEASGSPECLSKEELDRPLGGRFPMMVDLSPPRGALPTGAGIALTVPAVCGGSEQFVATSGRDDTQTDTLQVFQTEPNGPVPMSGELGFPGPILALHTATDAPRAIVQNLSTGNYEAYRLSISCGE